MPLRIGILAVGGILLAALANYVIYRWCLFGKRIIGPWGKQDESTSPVTWLDRIPVVGWLAMRRDVHVHGKGFWVRPMLIEIGMGVAVPALYWFETQTGLLLPESLRVVPGRFGRSLSAHFVEELGWRIVKEH